jgi:hypothetical protein
MTLLFRNNASTTLSGSINNSQTSITVISGSSFPSSLGSDYFYATMYEVSGNPAVEINIEIIKVTAVSGNVWTVVRAQDGTSARSRNGVTTCYIELRMTAASAALMLQSENNLSDLQNVSTARTNLGLGSMATQNASAVAITGGTISGITITNIDSTTTFQDNAAPTKQFRFEAASITAGNTRVLTVPDADGTIATTAAVAAGYQPLDAELTAIAGLSSNGLIARTSATTAAARTLTAPAAGITVTNGDGVAGNPTLALANDLAAVESINTLGFVRRTAADSWSASAITDGDLPSALTGKTYNGLTPTANATGFSLAGGTTSKTLVVNNSITLAGTDGTTITLPATSGTLPLNNQTFFIGTTSVAINRASASLSLTGVSIDGSAGSSTTATTATNLAGGAANRIAFQTAAATTGFLSAPTTADTYLRWDGTAFVWSAVSSSGGSVTSVGISSSDLTVTNSPVTGAGTISLSLNTVGIAKGGTGATTKAAAFNALTPNTTLGDFSYFDGSNEVRLAGNTSTTRQFLRQTGTGTVSAAPSWGALLDADIPATLTGKTYNGLTLTSAVTGFTVAGGTTSKILTVSNTLTLAGTDSSTLNIGAGGTLGSAAFTASTAYAPAAGSTSITTVGTVGAGTWQGSAIGISYGGTGATSKTAAFDALAPTTTLGDTMFFDGTDVVRLAGNTTTSKRFLTQTGTGTVSAAPGWNAIVDGDIPSALTGKTYNGLSLTANATGFQVSGGTTAKTLVVGNNLTLAGTDGSTLNIGGGGTLGTGAYATIANYALLASPTFTGTPAAPTAAVDTNTTQIATTAFVVGQAASASPLMAGTAAVGTSLRYARGDHVHPTDTSRAPLASPTFTGTPAAPTAAVDTNTTQLATTAYVVGQGYLKSAAASSTYLPLAGGTLTGNLVFSGTGRLIQGDFSNATNSSRTAFQSSTTNGQTVVTAKPNGTSTASYFITHNAVDVDNSSHMYMGVTSTQAQLRSDKTGTGSLLPLAIYVGGAERALMDTSGNLGIGTSSPGARLDVSGNATFNLQSGSQFLAVRGAASSSGNFLLQSNQSSGTAFWISAKNSGLFAIGGSGGAEPAGALNVNTSGQVIVGHTAPASFESLCVSNNDAGTTPFTSWNRATSGDNYFCVWYTEATATLRGSIDYNRAGGLVRYNTTSDYRAKDILGQVANPGATIDALKVYEGRMKGATQSRPMLVAHEAQEHAPYAVSGEKDDVNEDGTPKFQQMDVSSLVPLLLAEIQSLRARVAALEKA